MSPIQHNRLLLGLTFFSAFVSGGSSLLLAGMLTPAFGASHAVQTVLVVTCLAGLGAGHLAGAFLSRSERKDKLLLVLVLVAGLLLMVLPAGKPALLRLFLPLPLDTGLGLSVFCVLFVPLLFQGLIPPLVFANLKEPGAVAGGMRAGTFYALYLLGFALAVACFSFFIIPYLGIFLSCLLTGFLLSLVPAVLLFRNGLKKPGMFMLLAAMLVFSPGLYVYDARREKAELFQTGEWNNRLVVLNDFPADGQLPGERVVTVNGIERARYDPVRNRFGDSLRYGAVAEIMDHYFPGSDLLLLGLNGGYLPRAAAANRFRTDVVETDRNRIRISRDFFALDTSARVICEDMRRFLNRANSYYDLIIFDLFNGDEARSHVFTAEAVMLARNLLKPGGLALICATGDVQGTAGKGMRSIYKTIRSMGLYAELYIPGDDRLFFFFSTSRDAFDDRVPEYMADRFVPSDSVDVSDAVILTDNRPQFGYLNSLSEWKQREWYWRSQVLQYPFFN